MEEAPSVITGEAAERYAEIVGKTVHTGKEIIVEQLKAGMGKLQINDSAFRFQQESSAALGFGLVLVLFSAMRERLEAADVPAAWRGAPIALATAGLMSLAFMGFAGLVPA